MFGAICSLLMYGAISYMRYESRWVRGLVVSPLVQGSKAALTRGDLPSHPVRHRYGLVCPISGAQLTLTLQCRIVDLCRPRTQLRQLQCQPRM